MRADTEGLLEKMYVGNTQIASVDQPVTGSFVERDGELFYRISNSDKMAPFLMSIVSHSDHWLFISSNGALTAGRKDPDNALFPYYTDDKIHDSHEVTGSKTSVVAIVDEKEFLWEPFSDRYNGLYHLERNLYKNVSGTKLCFEEINHDLNLTLWYSWTSSERFGFVKSVGICNTSDQPISIRLLDGIRNFLPHGVNERLQLERSTLIDAYKVGEVNLDTGLGTFSLSSQLVDKPEPAESLKATTVWSAGLDHPAYLISESQIEQFKLGKDVDPGTSVRAERCAYFVGSNFTLGPNEEKSSILVAEINQGPAQVADLAAWLSEESDPVSCVQKDVKQGTEQLWRIVAAADGIQYSGSPVSDARHFSNVLFNLMRGGAFTDGYELNRDDFIRYLAVHSVSTHDLHLPAMDVLGESIDLFQLREWITQQGDAQLERIGGAYLPLFFSRRHGDPSRPWNRFSIETRDKDGFINLNYEGNWRDIFQNWEALLISYPGYISHVIALFLNASTPDGYNPYRITRSGIDWEVVDPNDPWSFIGYWGDHQIIYLLKILELSRSFHPGELQQLLTKTCFSYANVPYRIAPFASLIENPHETIQFDEELASTIENRVSTEGADGKLVWDKGGQVVLTNLTEKLLLQMLVKLTNFIPGAGIWMNTQRPEWNDANNALVGYGVSMVTLFYLRRYQNFLVDLFDKSEEDEFALSEEVATLLGAVQQTLGHFTHLLDSNISDEDRKAVLIELGEAGTDYRQRIYENGFSTDLVSVSRESILAFVKMSLTWIDHTIAANRRDDGLYHSYNLIKINSDGIAITRLYEMLEGQVALLSCGYLSADHASDVLASLRSSSLFRPDQYSYLLYPDRTLPRFEEKNLISADRLSGSDLIQSLIVRKDDRLFARDRQGYYHFNGSVRNVNDVGDILDELTGDGYLEEVVKDRLFVLDLFEEVFNHQAFTGRSGTFFGYEGLGSVYWHMVSKLLLAVNETVFSAIAEGANQKTVGKLCEQYYDIRSGIGQNKSPEEYGAFPSDPYSHTPGNAGAQQPGMTGQVKEDIIARWAELGCTLRNGSICFNSTLLRRSEFLSENKTVTFVDVTGEVQSETIGPDTMLFTFAQVPVYIHSDERSHIDIHFVNGSVESVSGAELGTEFSSEIFRRTGRVKQLDVYLQPSLPDY